MSIELTDEQLHAVQSKSLEILIWFIRYCKTHELTVYISAGTLLGAVRHKGFIPWDDDVDVMMPRPDYDKLFDIWAATDTSHYSLFRTDENTVTHDPQATVSDNLTTAVKIQHVGVDMPQGLSIDVFPLDGCPNGKIARQLQVIWQLLYGLFQAQYAPTTHGQGFYWAARAALALVPSKRLRYKIWHFAERRMTATPYGATDSVRFLYGGPIAARRVIPLDVFDGTTFGDINGHRVPMPVGYEDFLEVWFGDWRQLPPPSQRHPAHTLVSLDLGTPYRLTQIAGGHSA